MRIFPKPTVKAVALAIARTAVTAYVLFALFLYMRQDALLYFPDTRSFSDCPDMIGAEQLRTGDTRAYFFSNGTSAKLAVFYHGNAGRACERSFYKEAFEKAGYASLFVEYEGYAGDGKSPSTEGVLRNVKEIHSWLASQRFTELVFIGESIGSGAASYHALLAKPRKLILIAPFDTLSARVRALYPFYPISFLLKKDYDNVSWAKASEEVLIIHGTNDLIIPFVHGKRLYDSLPEEKKRLVPIDGRDHNETFIDPRTQDAIVQFLNDRE